MMGGIYEKATPRPWRLADNDPTIVVTIALDDDGNCGVVADVLTAFGQAGADDFANAELIVHAVNNIEALEAEVKVLREALAPFAEAADNYDYGDGSGPDLKDAPDKSSLNEIDDFCVGDLRRARAALSPKDAQP